MEHLDIIKVGDIIRKRRKELKLRLEDVADEVISTSTISMIERGKAQINPQKLNHLCNKIGLNLEELPQYVQEEKDYGDELKFELMAIEHDLDMVGAEEGLAELQKINLGHDDPLLAVVHYLKGRCYYKKGLWKKANFNFLQAIKLVDEHPEMLTSNVKAASYYELGRIHYFQNNLQQALQYTLDGLQAFAPDRERKYIEHHLNISKIMYLHKLNRTEEAFRTLDQMWLQSDHIKSTEVLLNMHEMKAALLNKMEKHEEAIQYALEGIQMARVDKMYDRSFELFTTLGESYTKIGELHKAERCFRTALKLKKKIKKEFLFISTHTHLGILYTKQGKMELAKSSLEEAVQIGKKTNHAFRYCEALIAKGDCYLKEGNNLEAISIFGQALEVAEQHTFHVQMHDILYRLARSWEKIDQKKYQKYLERFFKIHVQLQERGEGKMKLTDQVKTTRMQLGDDPPDP